MDEKNEMTNDVTHFVALSFPNIMPYINKKKQEAAMHNNTSTHAMYFVHHGNVNFLFFLNTVKYKSDTYAIIYIL